MKIFPITKERYLRGAKARTRLFAGRPVSVAKLTASPLQQFTPFSPKKTDTDSCAIGNGIPKSGTYLINSILKHVGKWEDIGVHVSPIHWSTVEQEFYPHGKESRHTCRDQFAVRKLRNGQLVRSHMPWSKALARSIESVTPERRVKHVFIYRDPRDLMVSHMNWLTHGEKFEGQEWSPSMRKRFSEQFADDDERLTHVIKNISLIKLNRPIGFRPWLDDDHCFAVRFEDLYPDIVGLKTGVFGDTIGSLLNYLEVDAAAIDPVDFFDKVHGKSLTASNEENKVGQYKKVFKEHHFDLLDTPEFRNTLRGFGYEW